MIEIINIKKPISLQSLEAAKLYRNGIVFTGTNQLGKSVEVVVVVDDFHILEKGTEYFFFKGIKFNSNKVAEGTVGSVGDGKGSYGTLILHI